MSDYLFYLLCEELLDYVGDVLVVYGYVLGDLLGKGFYVVVKVVFFKKLK